MIFCGPCKKKPIVIITSAYEEYALQSYELDVCDYLLKPFRFDRFLKAVQKAFEIHQLQQKQQSIAPIQSNSTTPPQQLFIKSDKRLIQLDLAEVYYLENYGNYVKFWLQDRYHLTPGTLAGFTAQLPGTDFFRIHKSYIIHRRYIDYVEGNSIMMKNKSVLPIGKHYRQAFKKFLS